MDLIYVAKLGKTTGLKGAQKLHIDSDFPDQFKKGSKLITNKKETLTIESYNKSSNTIKFVGIDDIDSAKKLTNRELFVTKDDTKEYCKLEENQFFWFDMVDCSIVEDEEVLGKVVDIQRLPLSDYLQIKTDKALVDSGMPKSFLIPYLDQYIQKVDLESKQIFTKDCKDILEAS